jgi:HEPN domain-containing protein
LLTIHKVEFTKTHNLVLLLDWCLPLIPNLDDYREQFAEMTAYAVEIRYPGDFFTPSKDEAKSALDIAEEVLAIVRQHFAEKTGKNK